MGPNTDKQDKKKKLLIITRFFPNDYFGGGEYVIYNIWKRACEHYDVSLISGWVNDPKLLPKGTFAVDLRSKNRVIRYLKLYFAVKKYAKKIKPDLIHTNALEIPILKIPTVATSHHLGHLLGKAGKKRAVDKLKLGFQRIFAKRKYKKFTKILAVSNSTKNDLVELGISPKKINVIYNGIEIQNYSSISKKTKDEKKKFIILYQSRISREKGQHIAIKALALLPKEIQAKVQLYIPGFLSDISYYGYLKKLAKGLPVVFKENVPNKDYVLYYHKCDLFVYPTLMPEGFGLVAAEALCCGNPVIASDFPAVREVVRDNGILIKPNDPRLLADAIIKLYKDKALRRRFGKQGRDFVLNNFSWDAAFKKYKAAYDGLLGEAR